MKAGSIEKCYTTSLGCCVTFLRGKIQKKKEDTGKKRIQKNSEKNRIKEIKKASRISSGGGKAKSDDVRN